MQMTKPLCSGSGYYLRAASVFSNVYFNISAGCWIWFPWLNPQPCPACSQEDREYPINWSYSTESLTMNHMGVVFRECYNARMLHCQNVAMPECYIIRMVHFQNVTMPECYIIRMLHCQNVKDLLFTYFDVVTVKPLPNKAAIFTHFIISVLLQW